MKCMKCEKPVDDLSYYCDDCRRTFHQPESLPGSTRHKTDWGLFSILKKEINYVLYYYDLIQPNKKEAADSDTTDLE